MFDSVDGIDSIEVVVGSSPNLISSVMFIKARLKRFWDC